MTHEQEHIIIRHYKDRVSYYGLRGYSVPRRLWHSSPGR